MRGTPSWEGGFGGVFLSSLFPSSRRATRSPKEVRTHETHAITRRKIKTMKVRKINKPFRKLNSSCRAEGGRLSKKETALLHSMRRYDRSSEGEVCSVPGNIKQNDNPCQYKIKFYSILTESGQRTWSQLCHVEDLTEQLILSTWTFYIEKGLIGLP